MYETIKMAINSQNYELKNMLQKISEMYFDNLITLEEKHELYELARGKAKVENSYNIQKQLDNIFERLEKLENKSVEEKPEEPTEQEEYPEYVQPTGAHDAYNSGDKITYNGKKYICKLDGCVWDPNTYPAAWEEVTTEEG